MLSLLTFCSNVFQTELNSPWVANLLDFLEFITILSRPALVLTSYNLHKASISFLRVAKASISLLSILLNSKALLPSGARWESASFSLKLVA